MNITSAAISNTEPITEQSTGQPEDPIVKTIAQTDPRIDTITRKARSRSEKDLFAENLASLRTTSDKHANTTSNGIPASLMAGMK